MPEHRRSDTEAQRDESTEGFEPSEGSNETPPRHSDTIEGMARSNGLALVADLLDQEATIPFAGLTPHDDHDYPDDVTPDGRWFNQSPTSLKEAIRILPKASEGELWTTNEFVGIQGDIDLEAIRSVEGLDVDALESMSGCSLEALGERAESEPIVRVRDHKDIVDERRKALSALGYDVKFRWQIASDSYAIINPQEAYLPIIGALQRRGENDAFGWVSYRDWGGLLKMFVVCPGLRHTVQPDANENDVVLDDRAGLTQADGGEHQDESELVVYGGLETGYDFRGTQTLWAKPILFFPDSGAVLPDTGERYTRRHYGRATDALHERANDRVPINEWWRSIYDDVDIRMITVDRAIQQTRAIAYDFEALPFGAEECYAYWGIAQTYAAAAAERATALARPGTKPTVFNLQLSLLIALLEHYEGSMASDTYQAYLEVAGELLRKPAMMIHLALKEHDRQVDDANDRILPDDQRTLGDTIDDLIDIPGIEVTTEVDLSDQQAQRLQDRIQRTFDDVVQTEGS